MRTLLTKKAFTRYTLEAILIDFSVLLALYLDNVFEDRRGLLLAVERLNVSRN